MVDGGLIHIDGVGGATHWAFVHNLLLWPCCLLKQDTVSLPPQNLRVTHLYDQASLILLEVLLGHHFVYSSDNLQLVGS
jgi:hypothetical protein